MNKTILLIEDEAGLVMTLSDRLRSEGYHVETASDGELGLQRALNGHFDLIILDIMLPLRSGLDVCRDLRQHNRQIPMMMLTARGQLLDKVVGLKIGADDYLTKPFEMIELLARVEALLRRAPVGANALVEVPGAEVVRFGSISVDLRQSQVRRGGKVVDMSALEFRLLRYFIKHRGVTLSRDTLLNEVWGYNAFVSTRTVDVHIAWLRQKLEVNPRHPHFILTVHGAGYKFVG
jgi:two-component system alkaline phosphatase synthesis response regulator PhoP